MKLLDNYLNKVFRTDDQGRRILHDPLGKEYLITSEIEYERIKREFRLFWVINFLWFLGALFLIPVIGRQGDLRAGILVIYIFMPLQIWSYYLPRHLKATDQGLPFRDRIAKRAARVPFEVLLIYEGICIGVIIGAIIILATGWWYWPYSLAAIIAIVFFGYRGFIVTKMLMAKG